jgi:hypothetical protein
MILEGMSPQPVPLMRAFRQAPWRTQTQAAATIAVVLLAVLVVGGLYLRVAARAATAGRDLQSFEAAKVELTQQNDELRAELARLRSVTRLADRARELGFQPAQPEQIEYLAVADFPHQAASSPPPRASTLPRPRSELAQIVDWLAQTLQGLVAGHTVGQGG